LRQLTTAYTAAAVRFSDASNLADDGVSYTLRVFINSAKYTYVVVAVGSFFVDDAADSPSRAATTAHHRRCRPAIRHKAMAGRQPIAPNVRERSSPPTPTPHLPASARHASDAAGRRRRAKFGDGAQVRLLRGRRTCIARSGDPIIRSIPARAGSYRGDCGGSGGGRRPVTEEQRALLCSRDAPCLE